MSARSRLRLGLLAALLVPLLLALQAPLLAAVVPGAVLTAVSLDALTTHGRELDADRSARAALVAADDVVEQGRVAGATAIAAVHRRVA